MKKALFIFFVSALYGVCQGSEKVFVENFDRARRFSRHWTTDAASGSGRIERLPDGGIDDSGCVRITSSERTSLAVKCQLTGLEQGRLYRVSARLKCEDVRDGRGAVLFLDPEGARPVVERVGVCLWNKRLAGGLHGFRSRYFG